MDESIKKILGLIGAGGLVLGAAVVPGALIALSVLFSPKTGVDRTTLYRRLQYAKRRDLIRVFETRDGVAIKLTKRGRRYLEKIDLIKPLAVHHWDRKWRIVIFDIPDNKKLHRDTLRRTLRQLGFRQLQESVWVTPYPCEKEIAAARQLFGLGKDVRLITADQIEDEEELLAKFDLSLTGR